MPTTSLQGWYGHLLLTETSRRVSDELPSNLVQEEAPWPFSEIFQHSVDIRPFNSGDFSSNILRLNIWIHPTWFMTKLLQNSSTCCQLCKVNVCLLGIVNMMRIVPDTHKNVIIVVECWCWRLAESTAVPKYSLTQPPAWLRSFSFAKLGTIHIRISRPQLWLCCREV